MSIIVNDKKKLDEIRRFNKEIINGNEVATFDEQLLMLADGVFTAGYPFIVGVKTPELSYIDGLNPDHLLMISHSTIRHIKNRHPSFFELSQIKRVLDNSFIAMDSMTYKDNSHKLVCYKAKNSENPVICAISIDEYKSKVEINEIKTVYSKKDFNNFISRTFNFGKNIYCNEKTAEFIRSAGGQFPMEMMKLLLQSNYSGTINKFQSVEYREKIKKFENEPKSFELDGYHFYPAVKFNDEQNTLKYIANNYARSNSLQIDYEMFYKKCPAELKDFDLFYCVERDSLFIPTGNAGVCEWKDKNIELDPRFKKVIEKYNQLYVNGNITLDELKVGLKDKLDAAIEKQKNETNKHFEMRNRNFER